RHRAASRRPGGGPRSGPSPGGRGGTVPGPGPGGRATLSPAEPHPGGCPYVLLGRNVRLGDRVQLSEGVSLGDGVSIGEDSVLGPRVVCYPGAQIGSRVVLKAGAVIGGDGFGYLSGAAGHARIPHIGGCILEDDVEVGSNSC